MKELTRAEDQVMQVLWKIGKGVVNDILDELPKPKPAYTTVSTIVRILETKGFVDHTAMGKTHEYFPKISREQYRRFSLDNMVNGYFDGSFVSLVSFFAKENKLKASELDDLRKHIDEIKKKKS